MVVPTFIYAKHLALVVDGGAVGGFIVCKQDKAATVKAAGVGGEAAADASALLGDEERLLVTK